MPMRWSIGLSDEVRAWYLSLTPGGKAAADRALERLATRGHLLRMPHSRPLGDGLQELRFTCEDVARRITYVLEPQRQAITLTTFRKQHERESVEVRRARGVLKARRAAKAIEIQERQQARHRGKKR